MHHLPIKMHNQCYKMQAQIHKYEHELEEAHSVTKDLRKELARTKDAHYQIKKRNLERQDAVKGMSAEINEKEKAIKRLTMDLRNLKRQVERRDTKIQDQAEQLQKMNVEYESLINANASMTEKLEAWKNHLTSEQIQRKLLQELVRRAGIYVPKDGAAAEEV